MAVLLITNRANVFLLFSDVLHVLSLSGLVYLTIVAVKFILGCKSLRTLGTFVRPQVFNDISGFDVALIMIWLILF